MIESSAISESADSKKREAALRVISVTKANALRVLRILVLLEERRSDRLGANHSR